MLIFSFGENIFFHFMIALFCVWQFQNDSKHILVHTDWYVSTNQHSEQQSK